MKSGLPATSSKPNRQTQRTQETRDLFFRAAETVFVRDGYDAECGFSSHAHLSTSFRKAVGVGPNHYRRVPALFM
jgi:hypothetical protein